MLCLLPAEAPRGTASAALPCLRGRCLEKDLLLTLSASPLDTKQWTERAAHTGVMGIRGERGGKAKSRQGQDNDFSTWGIPKNDCLYTLKHNVSAMGMKIDYNHSMMRAGKQYLQ